MLSTTNYLKEFERVQAIATAVTNSVAESVKPGATELEIADSLAHELRVKGLCDHWYPILICAGQNSGKPLSRRFHLPSGDVICENDIVIVDSTPMKETVWGNWSVTVAIGNDSFFRDLCRDSLKLVSETHSFAQKEAKTIGDIFDFCTARMATLHLTSLDPRDDVGHSIFQVPIGQTVDLTPLADRLFISEEYRDAPIAGLVSIEPQVGRINPKDGIMYGAKHQAVVQRD
jgi:Xaa-Pro aminopeptidase